MENNTIQIDVKGTVDVSPQFMKCYLYVDGSAYDFFLPVHNYEELVRDGFFIRDGKSEDSAGVINTTYSYEKEVTND